MQKYFHIWLEIPWIGTQYEDSESKNSMDAQDLKDDVRQFYNQVGWQKISSGVYQNAQYEDLRPVSRYYIHKCHLRVNRHIKKNGQYLLDAGSGPIQYPEYLTYSAGYRIRVCLDISLVALIDARQRIGAHGFFVVGDVSALPFKNECFDAIVSLHTLHHLAEKDYRAAYMDLKRVLSYEGSAVVVNGWHESRLMRCLDLFVRVMEKISLRRGVAFSNQQGNGSVRQKPQGTFVHKLDADGLRNLLGDEFPIRILVWRSVSVRFLRAVIHPILGGKLLLGVLYWLEEIFPKFFGENGQYPMIIFNKRLS